MTTFDEKTDSYLDRIGSAPAGSGWADVVRRSQRIGRRHRRLHSAALLAGAGAVAAIVLAGIGMIGGGGPSLVEKAEAAALNGLPPEGRIAHVRDDYRDANGHVFISYEVWVAADGAWCRRVLEEPVTDYTWCQSPRGGSELFLPASNEILHVPSGGAAGGAYEDGYVTDLHDLLATFQLEIAREAGEATLDGETYAKLETTDGDDVLVDPDTGVAVAWIPSPAAFGRETIVWRTSETVPDTREARASLSLVTLHPGATVREVSRAELERALAAQYPKG